MRRWLYLVISLMALGSMGSWAFSEARSMRDTSEVAQITEKMKAVCVGRYLIDVPDRSEISLSHERIHGFAIDTIEENETEFRQRIAQRDAEIEAHGGDTKPGLEGGMIELSWETRGEEADLLHPYLSLELQAGKSDTPGGKPVDTSLHEDALLAPWDRIASSIRPRSPDPISPRPNPGRADPRPAVAS